MCYILFDDGDTQVGELSVGIEGLLPAVALVLQHHHLQSRVGLPQRSTQLEPDTPVSSTLVLHNEQATYRTDAEER